MLVQKKLLKTRLVTTKTIVYRNMEWKNQQSAVSYIVLRDTAAFDIFDRD